MAAIGLYPNNSTLSNDHVFGPSNTSSSWVKVKNNMNIRLSDDTLDDIWKRLFERPVIIQCAHCESHNAITNPSCIRCGAPMGRSM